MNQKAAERQQWLDQVIEEALEPDLAICDPHHHLWDHPESRYLCEDIIADTKGHNVVSTVFIECESGYRSDGAEEMRPVGETEFVESLASKSFNTDSSIAVAAGIGLALAAARALGILADDTLADRTGRLLEALGLPRDLTALRASSGLALPAADVARAMGHDKKGRVGAPELVLPARAGAIELGVPVEPAMLTRLLA